MSIKSTSFLVKTDSVALSSHFQKTVKSAYWFAKTLPLWIWNGVRVCARAKSLQSCPGLYNAMDCSHQPPLSMGFSRQKYWSGLLCPPPGDLLNPGIKPVSFMSPAWQAGSLLLVPPGKPFEMVRIAIAMVESSDLHSHLPRGITCGLLKTTHTWLLS